jgi:hypothetical protein
MDVEEFAREVKPRSRRKRSRLLPFKDQIQTLKTQGYTDMQIRDWLSRNDVEVSRENVRKFIKNHLASADAELAPAGEHHARPPSGVANLSTSAGGTNAGTESQADRMRRQLREQQNEADKTRFRHDKTGNNN